MHRFPKTLRYFIPLVACSAIILGSFSAEAVETEPLSIGSEAPSLSVEHWIQDGNGFFEPVEDFEDGKVYVVEFWATWCPPCVASMPHLAELQQKYRGRDVQIISISTEPLSTIEPFMERQHPQVDKTFAEVTSAYSLTSDPDESTYVDYMVASKQNGIPMSFIVGKKGKVEWMGHPMLMDEPLEAVVEDSWDRQAFKQQFDAEQRGQEIGAALSRLYSAGRIDEALQLLTDEIEVAEYEPFKELLINLRYEIRYESDRLDDEVFAFYRKRLSDAADDPNALGQLAMSTLNALRRDSDLKGFDQKVIDAFENSTEKMSVSGQIQAHQIIAQMYIAKEDLDKAIAAQEKAVEKAEGSQKKRLQTQLESMQSQSETDADDATEDKETE